MRGFFEMHGVPGPTARVVCYDFYGEPNPAIFTRNGNFAVAAILTAEVHPVRIAFGGAIPTQGIQPVGHTLVLGLPLRICNTQLIRTMRVINATNGANGILNITPEYEIGE